MIVYSALDIVYHLLLLPATTYTSSIFTTRLLQINLEEHNITTADMASMTAMHPSRSRAPSIPAFQQPLAGFPSTIPSPTSSRSGGVPRGPVTASLNFYRPPQDDAIPFNYVEAPPAGVPQRNFSDFDANVSVSDLRGKEKDFNIEKNAFQALQGHPHNPAINWNDDESVKNIYYPEVEKLLLEATGGNRVLLFDHTIRRAAPNAHRAPVTRAHIDQTPRSAKQRVGFHLPDEAETLLKGRYRIINVWRPLNGPVETFPLAIADSNTVPDGDMVSVEHRYPDRTGETAAVRHNPAHRWYYWSGMDNDERLLLQCFDSAAPMTRVPHSAFVDGRAGEGGKPRESIEVRALVFG